MKRWPLPFVASFVLFIALCVSLAYWAMQLLKPPLRPVTAPPATAQPAPDLAAAASLFGGRSTMAVASNFQLQGVVMSGSARQSVAILTAEGKPQQAVRVGSEIVPGVTVKEVHRGYVLLADDGAIQRVELPAEADGMGAPSSAPPVSARGEGKKELTAPSAPGTSPSSAGSTTVPTPEMRTAPASQPTVVVSPPPSQPSTPVQSSTDAAPAASQAAPGSAVAPGTQTAPAANNTSGVSAASGTSATSTAPAAQPAAPPATPPAATAGGFQTPQYPAQTAPPSSLDPSAQPLRQTRPLQRLPSEQ